MSTPFRAPKSLTALVDVRAGQALRIVNLPDDHELCAQLRVLGIREGEVVEVLRHAPLGGPLHLRAECGVEVAVGHAAATHISGELAERLR